MSSTASQSTSIGPVILCIMDGWGLSHGHEHNAVALADTPNVDALFAAWPHARLSASGRDVGLPDGQVGNSEVGHMNIGAGRVVMQDLPRINAAMEDGSLAAHPELAALGAMLAETGGRVHVMGLMSSGGVHSHRDQMLAVINGLHATGAGIILHPFTDGRDVLPKMAQDELPAFLASLPAGVAVGTLAGRYFAMDRDNRWERTKAAYDAIAHGEGITAPDAQTALAMSYDNGETDEFVTPKVIAGYDGMRDGDAVVMVNFRADRVRQILSCWLYPEETGFVPQPVALAGGIAMTSYSARLDRKMTVLFGPQEISGTLGAAVAEAGRRQLRLAETEKYPHVTFFLNGGDEPVAEGEDRVLVPSPKVATYDLQPEMSAAGVLQAALDSIEAVRHDLLVINFANPDMVGHTGDLDAAVRAVETVDGCVGRLAEAVLAKGGKMLVTADHGNCEVMWDDAAGSPHTAHTTNLVPVILVGADRGTQLADGRLADLAPSLLAMMGIAPPSGMTGRPLQSVAGS
ncbi:MAG: 2,3-bisphosphoglycerate-independent phosphoglycerate mutase [SAR116 cluster bacterium]|nr:2,3-bisphosphoglycerate-independent phosphoglycerate mutase [SAR116 cluster bacterium]